MEFKQKKEAVAINDFCTGYIELDSKEYDVTCSILFSLSNDEQGSLSESELYNVTELIETETGEDVCITKEINDLIINNLNYGY